MDVNQTVGGGAGNAFSLSANGTYPKVTVGCLAQTSLALSLVTSEGPNSQTIRTTDTSASVTLTATLTKVGGGAVIGEPITFSLGAPIPACTGSTNGLGVVTCTFSPQVAPFPFGSALGTGFYFFSATFAGDANYGGTTSRVRKNGPFRAKSVTLILPN
jgi:hypothetical protein